MILLNGFDSKQIMSAFQAVQTKQHGRCFDLHNSRVHMNEMGCMHDGRSPTCSHAFCAETNFTERAHQRFVQQHIFPRSRSWTQYWHFLIVSWLNVIKFRIRTVKLNTQQPSWNFHSEPELLTLKLCVFPCFLVQMTAKRRHENITTMYENGGSLEGWTVCERWYRRQWQIFSNLLFLCARWCVSASKKRFLHLHIHRRSRRRFSSKRICYVSESASQSVLPGNVLTRVMTCLRLAQRTRGRWLWTKQKFRTLSWAKSSAQFVITCTESCFFFLVIVW